MLKNKLSLNGYMIFVATIEFLLPAILLSFLVVNFIIVPKQRDDLHSIHSDIVYIEQMINLQLEEYIEDFMSIVYLKKNILSANDMHKYVDSAKDVNDMSEFYIMDLNAVVVYSYPQKEMDGLNLENLFPSIINLEINRPIVSSSSEGVITILMNDGMNFYAANFKMDLENLLRAETMLSQNIKFYLVDKYNNILSTSEEIWIYKKPIIVKEKEHSSNTEKNAQHHIFEAVQNEQEYILATSKIEELEWTLSILVYASDFNRATLVYFIILGVTLAFMLLIMLIFQLLIKKRIVRPIVTLSEAFGIKAFSELDLVEIDYSRIAEIDDLIDGFKMLIRHLVSKKKEMDEFVYIASHDLQEPLRVMTSYINIIEMEYNDKIDDDGRKFLNYVVDASARMRTLILGLLDYSRASKAQLVTEEIELNEIVELAKENLALAISDANAMIIQDSLPAVIGERNALIQLFQNLIGNAIKFSEGKPMIKILYENNCIEVSDNGIGIDPDYLDLIFKPFKRLNKTSEYPGTGIGLSIVSKVVENHGWSIRVESEVNSGTRFIIDLEEKND